MERNFEVNVNGDTRKVNTDQDRSLLEVLREELGLTGTKYGCGEGECGACTVLLDGEPIRSCTTAISEVDRQSITTIEGLSANGTLHPVQQAFIEKRAMQCGYCVPGQILSAVALLAETPHPSREEIIEGMDGNLCRCCNYPNILAAVEHAVELNREARR